MSTEAENNNPEEILGTYKRMMAECQQIASKISEVSDHFHLLNDFGRMTYFILIFGHFVLL